jgi:hypothetical protein
MAGDERPYPSRELLDHEYPEHHHALDRGETDDSELGALGQPWGGMGTPHIDRRQAVHADHLAGEVPVERTAVPACSTATARRRAARNSGKRMEHAARGPGETTLSEIAACNVARGLAETSGRAERCHVWRPPPGPDG